MAHIKWWTAAPCIAIYLWDGEHFISLYSTVNRPTFYWHVAIKYGSVFDRPDLRRTGSILVPAGLFSILKAVWKSSPATLHVQSMSSINKAVTLSFNLQSKILLKTRPLINALKVCISYMAYIGITYSYQRKIVYHGRGPRLAPRLYGAEGENRAAALTLTSD